MRKNFTRNILAERINTKLGYSKEEAKEFEPLASLNTRMLQNGSYYKGSAEQALFEAERDKVLSGELGAKLNELTNEINQKQNHILIAPHPSPLSAYRGFFGCKHFSRINKILRDSGSSEINWSLE